MFVIRAILVISYLSLSCAIPLKVNAEIIFDAKINNQKVKLLFDTGSEAPVLFNKTVERLKLDVINDRMNDYAVKLHILPNNQHCGCTVFSNQMKICCISEWFNLHMWLEIKRIMWGE